MRSISYIQKVVSLDGLGKGKHLMVACKRNRNQIHWKIAYVLCFNNHSNNHMLGDHWQKIDKQDK